jgi:hypothetical protein
MPHTYADVPSPSTAARLRLLAGRIHRLGPPPLYELLRETTQDGTAKHGLSVMAWRVDRSAIGKNKPNKPSRASKSASNDFHDDQVGF